MEKAATKAHAHDETPSEIRRDFAPGILDEILELERSGETGLLVSLIEDYLVKLPELLARIDGALANREFATLEREAHSLKSSSYLLGLERTGDACCLVEDAARDGKGEARLVGEVRACVGQAIPELTKFKLDVIAETAGRAA